MSTADEIQALAQRFFGAVESGDIDSIRACLAPEVKIWHNTDGIEMSRDETIALLTGFIERFSSRAYANRRLQLFEGGFVQQHELRAVREDGEAVRLPCCVIFEVAGGRITRLDEYIDSAQVAHFLGSAEMAHLVGATTG